MADSISTTLSGGGIGGQQNSFVTGPPYQVGTNVGNGIAVFSGLVLTGSKYPPLQFRTLLAGNGVVLTQSGDSNSIIISSTVANTPTQTFFSPGDLVISVNNSAISINLANTTANAGVYTNPNVTIDGKGRVTSISNGSTANATIGIVSHDLLISNTPITVSNGGVFAIELSNTGVVAGTYTLATVAVDAKGRVKSISSVAASNLGLPNGTVTSVTATGSNAVSVVGNAITGTGTFAFDLTNTGVTPGTYTLSTFTVDQQGRILSANSGSTTDIGVTRVNLIGSNAITVSGSPITGQGTFTVDLAATGVAAGNYQTPSITVDAQGRLTSVTNGPTVTTVSVNSNDLTLNGSNVTGAGTSLTATGGVLITLSNTGIMPGSYISADIVVDSKGRIRGIQSGGSGGTVTSVGILVGTGLEVASSPITSSGNISLSLAPTGVTAGTYTKMIVDALGRVLMGNSISENDVVGALGYIPAPTDAPEFTGFAKGVTAPQNDNTVNLATTAFVQREIANAVNYLLQVIANASIS